MSFTPPTSLMDETEGVPSWSFKDKPVGTVYSGTVVSTEWRQQTDYDTNEPLWWNRGASKPSTVQGEGAQPVWQYVVTLDTDERLNADDDGRRRDFIKKGKGGTEVLRQAVIDAGLADLAPGCGYKKQFASTEPSSNPRFNDRKVYRYKVTPPVAGLSDFDTPADPASQTMSAADAF
jgi:hypothetical protein